MALACEGCGRRLSDNAESCPDCGRFVRQTAPAAGTGPSVLICPHCRVANPPNERNCQRCGEALPAAPGTVLLGRYRLEKHLKTGGFGAVYLARDTRRPDQPVVIKEMIVPDPNEFKPRLNFFLRESEILRILNEKQIHTVPKYYGFFQDEQERSAHLVMEFIPGRNLLETMEANGNRPFGIAQVVEWGKTLCDVLAVMHEQTPPLIHRDVKPDNIMLLSDGRSIKMIDFGTARWTDVRDSRMTRVYSEDYAPPEQMLGQPEPRSDLFALAATLYHLITGKPPRGTQTGSELADLLKNPSPSVPRWFLELLRTNLDAAVARRHPSARAFKADLERHPTGQLPSGRKCGRCSRLNPTEARYCYWEGEPLGNGPVPPPPGLEFPSPLQLPSGRVCHSFDDFIRLCRDDWDAGVQALTSGLLARFFTSIGRLDLAHNAQVAARGKDPDGGLNSLLGTLPGVRPAHLVAHLDDGGDLPPLRVGQDHSFDLRLVNTGDGLLEGSVTVPADCRWLSLGPAAFTKTFRFSRELTIPVHVKGLAACPMLKSHLQVSCNGGEVTLEVRLQVLARPFPHPGVLHGAASIRDLIARIGAAPYEAAPFFDNDSVRTWYLSNGWDYPLPGRDEAPPALGLDAVHQFFHALGQPPPTPPPPASPALRVIQLRGAAGEALGHRLEVRPRVSGIRPVQVKATSDQSWLGIGPSQDNDLTAVLLVVRTVPNQPGQTLQANVTLRVSDEHQREYQRVFPVTLSVAPPGAPR